MLLLSLVLGLGSPPPIIQPARPNVVFIMADDIGYGDLGCYGATKVKTPNLDNIAKSGVKFTDAHSAATVCTPTRYSLLSGEYSFRRPGGSGILSGEAPLAFGKSQATMPKMFQSMGYHTGVIGKWHLGLGEGKTDYNRPITAGPKEVGFDESFIIPATGDRVPCVFVENGLVVNYDPEDPIQVSFGKKIGDEPTGRENPELLKLKPVQGHLDTIINGVSRIGFMTGGKKARWVDEDIADTITGKAVKFIESNKHKPFFLYLATHDVHAPVLPHARFNGVSDCGLRGDTISQLDWSVGEVLRALKTAKIDKNTIIVFTSDNGAVDQDGYSDPRENLNGHRVNGMLRGTKYQLYEGGHRVPLVISWPAKMPKGKTSNALVTQTDFFASFAKLVGAKIPADAKLDSIDTSAAFFKAGTKGRESVVHHLGGFNSRLAYRDGAYVLIQMPKSWELYDVVNDLEQKNDLATTMPDKVEEMKAKLFAIAPPRV